MGYVEGNLGLRAPYLYATGRILNVNVAVLNLSTLNISAGFLFNPRCSLLYPLDAGHPLNVNKTFNLRPVRKECMIKMGHSLELWKTVVLKIFENESSEIHFKPTA